MRSIMLLSLLITAMMGYRPEGKNYRAMQAAAQRINQLASPDSILSEADSRSYVDALSSQWGGRRSIVRGFQRTCSACGVPRGS
jgi:hypothetical protein